MMDLRSDIEKHLHEVVRETLHHFDKGTISRKSFMEIMTLLRNANVTLNNRRDGCYSGKHREPCLCHAGIMRSVQGIKNAARRKHE